MKNFFKNVFKRSVDTKPKQLDIMIPSSSTLVNQTYSPSKTNFVSRNKQSNSSRKIREFKYEIVNESSLEIQNDSIISDRMDDTEVIDFSKSKESLEYDLTPNFEKTPVKKGNDMDKSNFEYLKSNTMDTSRVVKDNSVRTLNKFFTDDKFKEVKERIIPNFFAEFDKLMRINEKNKQKKIDDFDISNYQTVKKAFSNLENEQMRWLNPVVQNPDIPIVCINEKELVQPEYNPEPVEKTIIAVDLIQRCLQNYFADIDLLEIGSQKLSEKLNDIAQYDINIHNIVEESKY